MKHVRSHLPQWGLLLALLIWTAAVPVLPGWAARVDQALRSDGLNRIDRERQERGYYEQLLDAGRSLAEATQTPPEPPPEVMPISRILLAVDDVRETINKPAYTTTLAGQPWTTSEWGLRDREYAASEPTGTVRFALLGDSIGAAWGTADGQGFEPRIEVSLDRLSREGGGPAVEILNYAVPGHAPGQRFEHYLRSGGWDRGIDLILYEATPADVGWDVHRLRRVLTFDDAWSAVSYRDTLRELGLAPGGAPDDYRQQLRPYRWEVLGGVYEAVVAQAHARGVPCVWFMIPRVGKSSDQEDQAGLLRQARQAGFDAIIDLSDAFEGLTPAQLAVAPADYHPNALGHARIADRLLAVLWDNDAVRRLWWRPLAPASDNGEITPHE